MAAESQRLEDLVPLGALHADLGEFDEADRIYQKELRVVVDPSPFFVARFWTPGEPGRTSRPAAREGRLQFKDAPVPQNVTSPRDLSAAEL